MFMALANPGGLVSPGNIDINRRKVFNAPNGSYRTENSISVGTDAGEVLIPTIINGRQVSEQEAIAHFERTGENLGTFRDAASADAYAQALHQRQAERYDPGNQTRVEQAFSTKVEPMPNGQQFTLDQQKAMAMGAARMRMAQGAEEQPGVGPWTKYQNGGGDGTSALEVPQPGGDMRQGAIQELARRELRMRQIERALVNADKAGDTEAARKLAKALKEARAANAQGGGKLAEFRRQYPEYNDKSDAELSDALHRKFYSDMPREEFDARMNGGSVPGQSSQAGTTPPGAGPWMKYQQQGQSAVGFPGDRPSQMPDGIGSAPTRVQSGIRGAAQGISFNLADEIAGGGAQKKAMLQAATDQDYLRQLNEAYSRGDIPEVVRLQRLVFERGNAAQEQATQSYREADRQAKEANPGTFTLGEIGGGLATLPLGGLRLSSLAQLPAKSGLGARTLASIKDAGIYGAAYGFGAGENADERASGAISGGITGAAIGGVIPGVTAGASALTRPVVEAVTSRIAPERFATRKIAERLASDGTDLTRVERRMDRGGMMMADAAGENTRGLLRSTVNIPGGAKDIVTARMNLRQMGQGERLKETIRQTFADPDGYLAAKDRIAETARTNAAPIYDRAYSKPVPFTRELESIMTTPAGRDALRRASTIAENEQAPFRQWFINVADDGVVSVKRVPDMRAWDYIKRGMDDMIDRETDSVTGKVTTSGRAIIGLKKRLLSYLDRANPDYAAARKIAADGFRLDDALEFGRKATGMPAASIERRLADFSEAEKQVARIGYAEALRGKIDAAGWTHNKILQVMRSPEQYRALRAMAPSGESFKAMRTSIMNEARKQATYNATRGNSTTASQLMDMQDAGRLGEIGLLAADVTRGNIMGVVGKVGGILQRMGGLTPAVTKQIANRLTTTNPGTAQRVLAELRAIEERQISRAEKRNLVQGVIGQLIAGPIAQ